MLKSPLIKNVQNLEIPCFYLQDWQGHKLQTHCISQDVRKTSFLMHYRWKDEFMHLFWMAVWQYLPQVKCMHLQPEMPLQAVYSNTHACSAYVCKMCIHCRAACSQERFETNIYPKGFLLHKYCACPWCNFRNI